MIKIASDKACVIADCEHDWYKYIANNNMGYVKGIKCLKCEARIPIEILRKH